MFNLFQDVSWNMFTHRVTDLITPVPSEASYVEMNIKIIPDWKVSVYLEWDPILPPDTGIDDDDVSYMVYSSDSELGPFIQVTPQPISDTSYFTYFQTQDSKVYEQYFTIEVLYGDGRKYRSYPLTPAVLLSKWHQLRQKDIIRREYLLLDKFVGAESIIYTKKRSGLRCPACWDPVHKKVTSDHCEECYGTSYNEGYDTGMRTKLQYTSIDPVANYSYQGSEEPVTISAWGLAFPVLHPNALVLRVSDRKVFRVEGHQGSTEMLTTMQRQNVVLRELGRDSVEYRLFNRPGVIDVTPRVPHVHT